MVVTPPREILTPPVSLPGGCDSPDEVAEAPVLHLPSPGSPIMPVEQVRQFSWRFSGKHGLYRPGARSIYSSERRQKV